MQAEKPAERDRALQVLRMERRKMEVIMSVGVFVMDRCQNSSIRNVLGDVQKADLFFSDSRSELRCQVEVGKLIKASSSSFLHEAAPTM